MAVTLSKLLRAIPAPYQEQCLGSYQDVKSSVMRGVPVLIHLPKSACSFFMKQLLIPTVPVITTSLVPPNARDVIQKPVYALRPKLQPSSSQVKNARTQLHMPRTLNDPSTSGNWAFMII